MKIIDLRSDTVTLPSPEMRKAMYDAEVGDDVYGEDPTVNRLEHAAAELLGKEAGLFVASGTMGNVVSLLTHCGRGTQAIAGNLSHIVLHEAGAPAVLGGLFLRNVMNNHDGTIDLDHVRDIIADEEYDIHKCKTEVLCIENTFHGQVLPLDYIESVVSFARQNRLKLHLDGARIFNAAVALKVNPSELTKDFDSIQFCFSKGLAAPVGSMICGSAEFIQRARRLRKMFGGGMRQVGVIAAACQVGLDKMIGRLEDDHANAERLADGLSQIEGVSIAPASPRTNMVFFRVPGGHERQSEFAAKMTEAGVPMFAEAELGIRAVTHYGIEAADIDEAVNRVKNELREIHGTLHRAGAPS